MDKELVEKLSAVANAVAEVVSQLEQLLGLDAMRVKLLELEERIKRLEK